MKPNEEEWMCKTKQIDSLWNATEKTSFKMGLEIGIRSKHKEAAKKETIHFFFTFKYINFNWVVVGDSTYNKVII